MFHSKGYEFREGADSFALNYFRVVGNHWRRRRVGGRAQQSLRRRPAAGILHLKVLTVSRGKRRYKFGLNFQRGKIGSVESEIDVDVPVFIKPAVNGSGISGFSIGRDDELRGHERFELRSGVRKLRLCHDAVVIVVQIGELRGVLDCERQRRLQAVWAWANRHAAKPGIMTQRAIRGQDRE